MKFCIIIDVLSMQVFHFPSFLNDMKLILISLKLFKLMYAKFIRVITEGIAVCFMNTGDNKRTGGSIVSSR